MTALAKLPEKWRKEAAAEWAQRQNKDLSEWVRDRCHGQHARLLSCADELEAALSPAELGGVEQWTPSEVDYDRSIHANPDAAAWLPIESAPKDGALHIRGLHVFRPDGSLIGWQAFVGRMSDDGIDFIDADDQLIGWEPDDYTHWRPLPAPPSAKGES